LGRGKWTPLLCWQPVQGIPRAKWSGIGVWAERSNKPSLKKISAPAGLYDKYIAALKFQGLRASDRPVFYLLPRVLKCEKPSLLLALVGDEC
jgi:hypothetical protein